MESRHHLCNISEKDPRLQFRVDSTAAVAVIEVSSESVRRRKVRSF